ncbi:MAG: HPr(Ser) kinase/phosphatase [Oscillospiraceae bacterium]|nr:HPr(Ser) kinase/phosphatase [Oscillospiraceae bacterium]MCD7803615.1 HPr(Ser) kinase/phosphatase [Oscillospiraceae bacterium]MCD7888710.1 HPr(Ser) kinase/phosphatase [Oscillospiraceae bacterium]
MAEKYTVSLAQFAKEVNLKTVYTPKDLSKILISNNDINRPGLQLTGFYAYFNNEKIQICGNTEFAYLQGLSSDERKKVLMTLFSYKFPALIISRGHEPFPEMMDAATEYGVPVLSSELDTSEVISRGIAYLNTQLGQRITRHGVLIEIYGEGVLIVGESGVGKSETAIELVKRGHRLVADDAVEIKKVSAISLVGSSPDNIRHFIELRGIGIVNARRLFGMGAVKMTEKIDLVVKLEIWDPDKVYDRMGVDSESMDILGVNIPCITIPVKPGRNLAVILEVAAMNNRQKKMGYNAAQELLNNLGLEMEGTETVSKWEDF